jgi:hypothetical protein
MQHHNVALSRQQVRRSFSRNTKDSAVHLSRWLKSVKPFREWYQRRRRRVSWRVKLCQYRAHRATGLVIRAVASIVGKGRTAFGAFHEDRISRMRQHPRRPLSIPPDHQYAAQPLLLRDGYFEHGG